MPLCDGGVPRSQGLGGRRQGEQASERCPRCVVSERGECECGGGDRVSPITWCRSQRPSSG